MRWHSGIWTGGLDGKEEKGVYGWSCTYTACRYTDVGGGGGGTVPCGWALPVLTGPEWGRGKDDTISESAPGEFTARLQIDALER